MSSPTPPPRSRAPRISQLMNLSSQTVVTWGVEGTSPSTTSTTVKATTATPSLSRLSPSISTASRRGAPVARSTAITPTGSVAAAMVPISTAPPKLMAEEVSFKPK